MVESAGASEWVRWRRLNFYQKFEQAVLLFLTALIAVVVVAAIWNLTFKILFALVFAERFDPTEPVLAILVTVRKLIILDLATTEPLHVFALATVMAALGGVYWSGREQDRREQPSSG